MNHFRGHHHFPSAVYVDRERFQDECDRYPQYSKYSSPPPGNRSGSNSEWDRPGSSSQHLHSEEQEPEDYPDEDDGLPYESDEEDPELARKRKELQVIEEQIMLKRASLALKTVDFNPGHCTEETRPSESNETLRERVKLILMQRNRMIGSKGPVPKTRRSSINIQRDHPLKHRVKVALEQRFVVDSPVEAQNYEKVKFFQDPPCPQIDSSTIDSSTVEEEEKGNQGFLRFLNILNKGVDIDKLTEMVIDDPDSTPEPPQPQLPHNSQKGGETYDESSSFSSPLEEKRPRKEEEQQIPDPEEQQQHLHNILESLGLSLGTDEINKLADRTQKRLYGKTQRTEEENPQIENECQRKEGKEKYSPGHYTRSSSGSTSSSTSKRSPTRTQSPLRRRRSGSSSHRHRSSSSPHRYRSPHGSSHRHRRSRSPYRHRNPNRPYRRRDSRSPQRRRNSNSPYRRRDSRSPERRRNSNSPYRRRDSRSPERRRNSNSPYRRRDSRSMESYRNSNSPYSWRDSCSPQRRRSSDSRDLRDSHLQYQSPAQPYPYPPSHYCSAHFPPQMFADAYSQYAAYYWAYNQPPLPGAIDPSNQNYPQTIPPAIFNQQTDPHNSNSLFGLPLEEAKSNYQKTTRCLVTIKQMSITQSRKKRRSRGLKIRPLREKTAKKKQKGQEFIAKKLQIDPDVKKSQDWATEINNVIEDIKQAKTPKCIETIDTSGVKKKKKKKKNLVFIERNEQMEKLLIDRPGPVTRALAVKNPAKLAERNGKLIEINDIEDPLRELWEDMPLKIPLESMNVAKVNAEPKEEKREKPVLTEEEIKSNLKFKLEAFNSRMKKNSTQTTQLLTPHKVKVEDEI